MKIAWLLPLVLMAPDAATQTAAPTSWADRLAWNARERTAEGLRERAAAEPEKAVPAFETALRLRPEDPLARFNAGTARFEAQDPSAAPLLEAAAQDASKDLAPAAWYNLGNARLAAGDPAGAIEAYRDALRLEPAHLPSKHNLEVALRELEKQQQQQQQQQEQQQQQDQEKEEEKKEQGQDQKQEQEQEQERQQQQQQQQQEQEQEPQEQEPQEQGSGREQPLPQFQDQKDMTTEQAAALLEAVEDLERQQRRERALDQARQRATVEKDW